MSSILCLQQDSDMEYFNLDISPILKRATQRGDVQHVRYRINDFDGFDLRMKLPGAAAAVARGLEGGKKIYIHCTAGKQLDGGVLEAFLPLFLPKVFEAVQVGAKFHTCRYVESSAELSSSKVVCSQMDNCACKGIQQQLGFVQMLQFADPLAWGSCRSRKGTSSGFSIHVLVSRLHAGQRFRKAEGRETLQPATASHKASHMRCPGRQRAAIPYAHCCCTA